MPERTPRSELKQAIKILTKAMEGHWGKTEHGWHSGSPSADRALATARALIKGENK